jgi:Kef-type K+ transport system membrane component KefB
VGITWFGSGCSDRRRGMLVVAKLGGEIFERIGQPAVLGELFAGIFLGNLVIFGF